MPLVTWDPAAFRLAYPEFASVSDARTLTLFDIAQYSLLDNVDNNPAMDVTYRTQLFHMLVAHLLALFGATPTASDAISRPPGRVNSATEGTVSAGFEYNIPTGSAMAAWYTQTKYGAMYWAATARFRSARYMVLGGSGVGVAQAFGVPPVNRPGGV